MANTLRGSVGLNGNNWYTDIATIQDMLNVIPDIYGGAAPPFFTFGNYSQQLIDAIRNFQQMNHLYCDGRVDVNGASFRKMLELQGKHLPPEDPGTPKPPPGVSPAPPAPTIVKLDKALRGCRISNWQFRTSAGGGFGVWKLGASGGYLDFDNSVNHASGRLRYGAIGGGMSLMPASAQFSTQDCPSYGVGNVYLSNKVRGEGTLNDFRGYGGMISGGIVVYPGYQITIYLMGVNGLMSPSFLANTIVPGFSSLISLGLIANAICIVRGMVVGSPDANIGLQNGIFF